MSMAIHSTRFQVHYYAHYYCFKNNCRIHSSHCRQKWNWFNRIRIWLLVSDWIPFKHTGNWVRVKFRNHHFSDISETVEVNINPLLVIYLHQLIRLTLSLYSTDDADKDAFGMLQVYIHNELKVLLAGLFDQRKNSMFLSIVGFNTTAPSPTFQLLVKV